MVGGRERTLHLRTEPLGMTASPVLGLGQAKQRAVIPSHELPTVELEPEDNLSTFLPFSGLFSFHPLPAVTAKHLTYGLNGMVSENTHLTVLGKGFGRLNHAHPSV